jgi:gliding motility-associated lipoprotein GldJ
LVEKGYINKNQLKTTQGQGQENFNTQSYLKDLYQPQPGKPKKNPLMDANGRPRLKVTFEDGYMLPNYRLPTEAEWEYAAYGYINQNPRPKKKSNGSGEELIKEKQVYSWSQNVNGLRDGRHGSWQGKFLANFKRGSGDMMGVAGGLNDNASIPGPVDAFYPNGFGLYNMSGNVNEWVSDVYRPLSSMDNDDFNPYRGNRFEKFKKNENSEFERDSLGRVVKEFVTDEESKNRRNYQRGDVIDYLDGDSASQVTYGYGKTTLISDHARVIKGGSWNDRAYWLSPGTRRFLEEDQATSTIGFRCAMDRMGSPEGNKRKTGNFFRTKKQKR